MYFNENINWHNQYGEVFSSILNILLILTKFANYVLKLFHCIILAIYPAVSLEENIFLCSS